MKSFALVGPTASGKTSAALMVMDRCSEVEAVSVDSMTIYKEFSIGTAKPDEKELRGRAYHLLSVASVSEEFSLARFLDFIEMLKEDLRHRGKTPLYVGGTSLYLRAVVDQIKPPPQYLGLRRWLEERLMGEGLPWYWILKNVDPLAATKIEENNLRRIIRALEVSLGSGGTQSVYGDIFECPPSSQVMQIGIRVERHLLYERIENRIHQQLASGWVEEVENILSNGIEFSRTAAMAIGYMELARYLNGEISYEQAVEETLRRTKRLAKRQSAWLERDPRIKWSESPERAVEILLSYY